jgi:hypothetical protein
MPAAASATQANVRGSAIHSLASGVRAYAARHGDALDDADDVGPVRAEEAADEGGEFVRQRVGPLRDVAGAEADHDVAGPRHLPDQAGQVAVVLGDRVGLPELADLGDLVRVDLLLKVMVETDLESWHVVLREAVIAPLRDHEVENRKSLRGEERRLQGREPAQHLPLRLSQPGERRTEHLPRCYSRAASGGRPALGAVLKQPDLANTLEALAAELAEEAGVPNSLLAVGQPCLDPDADGAGNSRVGLLAFQRLDPSQGGADQPGRVLLAGGRAGFGRRARGQAGAGQGGGVGLLSPVAGAQDPEPQSHQPATLAA